MTEPTPTLATGELTRYGRVIDYLLDVVRPALAKNRHGHTIQMHEGDLTDDQLEDECILIGNTQIAQEWAAIGARRKDENLTVDVLILVSADGQTPRFVRERAIAIGNDMARVLRSDQHRYLGSAGGVALAQAGVMFRAVAWNPFPVSAGRGGALRCELLARTVRF